MKDIQDGRIVAKDMLKLQKSGAVSIRKEHRGTEEWYMMKKIETEDGDVMYVLEPDEIERGE